MRALILALVLALPGLAQTFTLGDSHAQMCYLGTPLAVQGATYQELARGFKGSGRFAGPLQRLRDPREIILAFGTNDSMGLDPSKFRPAFTEVITALRTRWPRAHITVWGPPEARAPQMHLDPVTKLLHDLTGSMGLFFVDRRFLTPDMFQRDGIHLTPTGYTELLRRTRFHTETYP